MTDDLDAVVAAAAQARINAGRARIKAIEEAEASQPGLLAQARKRARAAREECLADPDNSWQAGIKAVPTVDPATGQMTGMLGLPDLFKNELWGARLAFDLLSVAGDEDAVEDLLPKYLLWIKDPAHAWLVAAAALSTIAQFVVPTMLDQIERQGSNWDARVLLAEAAENAWRTAP